MNNLLSQLAPGGSRVPERSSRQVDVPSEPSPLLQPEIILTIAFLAVALILWIATSMMRERSGRG